MAIYNPIKPWPWAIEAVPNLANPAAHEDPVVFAKMHLTLALLGHYTLEEYFTLPITRIIDESMDDAALDRALAQTLTYDRVNLGTSATFRPHLNNVRAAASLLINPPTVQWLLLNDETAAWANLGTQMRNLDAAGMTLTVIRKDASKAAEIHALFSDPQFFLRCGHVTLRQYRSVFKAPNGPAAILRYREAHAPDQRVFFDRIRDCSLLTCEPVALQPGQIKPTLVNNKCWSESSNTCTVHSGTNCDGGPGPGTDTCA